MNTLNSLDHSEYRLTYFSLISVNLSMIVEGSMLVVTVPECCYFSSLYTKVYSFV